MSTPIKYEGSVRVQSESHEMIQSFRNAFNIHDADVHHEPINAQAHRHTATSTTLSAPAVIGATSVTVTSATGFIAGDKVHLGATEDEFGVMYTITNVAGSVVTLNAPLDQAYSSGSNFYKVEVSLAATSGSLASPITYTIAPPSGRVWHLTNLNFSMTHSAAADDSKFGSLAALTNGLLFRVKISGVYSTVAIWRINRDIIEDMFEVIYSDKAGGGLYGTRGQWAGLNTFHSIIRLDGSQGDKVEFLVQDNLTTMADLQIKMQGHREGN